MFFNLFKPKKKQITAHQINVKLKKNKSVYIGQILKIDIDIDNDNYYLSSYTDGYVSSKISAKEEKYCQEYSCGIVKEIIGDTISFLIICQNGYLNRLKIELYKEYSNGSAFVIKNGILYDNKEIVGKIIDDRYDNQEIIINSLENDKLAVFINK